MTEIRLNEMKYWMERKIHHRKGVNSSELFGFENVHFSRNDVSPFFSCTIFRYTIIHIDLHLVAYHPMKLKFKRNCWVNWEEDFGSVLTVLLSSDSDH